MPGTAAKPMNVDADIAALPAEVQAVLQQVRQAASGGPRPMRASRRRPHRMPERRATCGPLGEPMPADLIERLTRLCVQQDPAKFSARGNARGKPAARES